MTLDLKLTQIGLKMKQLVVLDLSFPKAAFPEFKKAYEQRYIHLPNRNEMALPFAAGLASFGKVVIVYGGGHENCDLPDASLNVKLVKMDSDAVWDYFEEGLKAFGPAVLLIPGNSDTL